MKPGLLIVAMHMGRGFVAKREGEEKKQIMTLASWLKASSFICKQNI